MFKTIFHPNFCISYDSLIRCSKQYNKCIILYHSIFNVSSSSNKQQQVQESNQITLDYATLLKYVRPEMKLRIQQLIDHENYLSSLSNQIKQKQQYLENMEKTQKYKEPQFHNQKLSKMVVESLQSVNENEEDEGNLYEPGLDLQDLSSIKTLKSTFFGPNPLNGFDELKIDKHLIKALGKMGIAMPSHIQQLSIPQILNGHNCVIGAETGTGKTISYALPILQKLLNDKTVTETKYDLISKFKELHLSKDNERKHGHKYHPFEFDAEKKYPSCIIIQPNEHLCNQTQFVINEILWNYYDSIYFDNNNNLENIYKLKTMSLYGRALLPKSNDLMPDILITTPTALLTNIHKKHNENRFRSFLSKIKYIILDEADYLTRSSSRHQIRYLFKKLKELRHQIENNPLKYKLLLPKYVRDTQYGSSSSLLYRELNKIGKPQMIFVGATIPTEGGRNIAETIRDWLDKAIWIRTPGLHQISPHIAQQFRFVPREMELDILHQILIGLTRDHYIKNMFETDDDILYNKDEDKEKFQEYDTGRHRKRKRRPKKPKNWKELELQRKNKTLHILIFVNTKKFTRECYSHLLNNGWFNTRCIHSQLHRQERKQRIDDFQQSIPCVHTDINDNLLKKNIVINEHIDDEEYKQVVDNVHILVTSDFANRGLDFKNVDIVINAQFPSHAIDYLHRCGRTGRGGNQNGDYGKVISFFNEYDLDLAWHIQMGLINQYKQILQGINDNDNNNDNDNDQDSNRIGTTFVQLNDCFGVDQQSLPTILKYRKNKIGGYRRMSLSRDYQKNIDLTRIDLDDMDDGLVSYFTQYANKQKWINNDTNDSEKKNDRQQLKELIEHRKENKKRMRVPFPYNLEFANQ